MPSSNRRLAPEEWALAGLLLVMTVIVVANVLSRYLFHAGIASTVDLAVNLFVWVVFLAAGLSISRRVHVGFTVLSDQLPENWRRAITAVGDVVFMVLFAVWTTFGISMAHSEFIYNQRTPVSGWPEWWFGAAVPAGSFLALLRTGSALVGTLQGKSPGKDASSD